PEDGGVALHDRISVRNVSAPENVRLDLAEALEDRIYLPDGQTPDFALDVTVRERAERLAVQLDDTTTRYNYRLSGRFSLINLKTGERFDGNANSISSYNIVASTYSTLFAERTAQEKAARQLAVEIEREILLAMADDSEAWREITPQEDQDALDALPLGSTSEEEVITIGDQGR
ncbi:MAG: LPS assembly lipoprotein LptE, partial [Pseudomonadota bacterium]